MVKVSFASDHQPVKLETEESQKDFAAQYHAAQRAIASELIGPLAVAQNKSNGTSIVGRNMPFRQRPSIVHRLSFPVFKEGELLAENTVEKRAEKRRKERATPSSGSDNDSGQDAFIKPAVPSRRKRVLTAPDVSDEPHMMLERRVTFPVFHGENHTSAMSPHGLLAESFRQKPDDLVRTSPNGLYVTRIDRLTEGVEIYQAQTRDLIKKFDPATLLEQDKLPRPSHINYKNDSSAVCVGGAVHGRLLVVFLETPGWVWKVNQPRVPQARSRVRPSPLPTDNPIANLALDVETPNYRGWKTKRAQDRAAGNGDLWANVEIDHHAPHNRLAMDGKRGATKAARTLEGDLIAAPSKAPIHRELPTTGNSGYTMDPDRQKEKYDASGFPHGQAYDEDYARLATDLLAKHGVANALQLHYNTVGQVRAHLQDVHDDMSQYHALGAKDAIRRGGNFNLRMHDRSLMSQPLRARDIGLVEAAVDMAYTGHVRTHAEMLAVIREVQGPVDAADTPTDLTLSPPWHTVSLPTARDTYSLRTPSLYGENADRTRRYITTKRYVRFLAHEHERRSNLARDDLASQAAAKHTLEAAKHFPATELQDRIGADDIGVINRYTRLPKNSVPMTNVKKENLRSAIYAFCEDDEVTIWDQEGKNKQITDQNATIHMRVLKEAAGFERYVDLMTRLRTLCGKGEIKLRTTAGDMPRYNEWGVFQRPEDNAQASAGIVE